MRDAVGIIPARYNSKRFPGKPLAPILGKPMIQWVYQQAMSAQLLHRVIVATDDERIFRTARSFGAEVWMTSPRHRSGMERVSEIAEKLDIPIVLNIQGDHPVVKGQIIDELIQALQPKSIPMATLVFKRKNLNLLSDRNIVKVVIDRHGYALYFSRSPLPFQPRDYFWHHVGIYAYQRDFLLNLCQLPLSRLEKTENLEQLRALENGYKIKTIETSFSCLSVDSPQDIIKVENFLKNKTNVQN